ncbi:MAG: hypothetical protein ABSG89_04150 [Bacteroidales bacterium]|jgi:ParB-like chromosome segregation protein Spo0J
MKIKEEFKNLLFPLTPEEYQVLEASILKEGCWNPLVLWNDTLIDGHNRYEICTKHHIEFKTIQMDFKDDIEAKKWILNNQLGRRNLTPYRYCLIAIAYEDLFKATAKKKQSEAGKLHLKSETAPFHSLKEMAKIAKVSPDTIWKVMKIQEKGSEELKKRLAVNEISVNKAYQEMQNKPDKDKVDELFKKICNSHLCQDELKRLYSKIDSLIYKS